MRYLFLLLSFSLLLNANNIQFNNAFTLYKIGQYQEALDGFYKCDIFYKCQAMLGYMYQHGEAVKKDINTSKKWYTLAANNGDLSSMNILGMLYVSEKNYKKSFFWFERSAKRNQPESTYNMGMLYMNGLGVTQDFQKAKVYFQKAYKLHYEPAKEALNYIDKLQK